MLRLFIKHELNIYYR